MLTELSRNINKKIIITLTNGKEKQGIIVSIDTESNTVRLRDEGNNSISILISMIGMLEPSDSLTATNTQTPQLSNNPINITGNNNKIQIPQHGNDAVNASINNIEKQSENYEILHKLTIIEATFDSEIKNSILEISKPNFETPSDIMNLQDSHSKKLEAISNWNWIKLKYDNAIKMGRLAPNSDELKAIILKTKNISQSQRLINSSILCTYLGYFYYLNNDNTACLKTYIQAAKLSNESQDWLNIATVASGKGENEMACYTLEKFFVQVACTESQYEKAWYKFTGLIIQYSAYNSFRSILNNTSRILLKDEQQKIFETICYCLFKKNQQEIAKTQLCNSLINYDYKKISLDCLEVLPQYPISSYDSFKHRFESLPVKREVLENKPLVMPPHEPNKYVFKKYTDILKEARSAKDIIKDYNKAEELFIKGIELERNISIKERAVRDLASMLSQQMNSPAKAIQVIEKYQTALSERDLNLLYNFYYQLGEYEKGIKIQKDLLKNTGRTEARLTRYLSMAACYLQLSEYLEAEKHYRNALNLNRANYSIMRNIAFCLYNRGEIDEAKTILKKLINDYSDAKSIDLLDNFENKNVIQIGDIIIDTAGLVFENLDTFTNYYLTACDLKYVDKSRLSEEGKYIGDDKEKRSDIKKLEDTASTLRSKIAEERSNIYLNAARIFFDLGEKNNHFYKYLCRSFASKGDNSVQSGHSSDTIKTYYLTALKVYDALYLDDEQYQGAEEQDAINALSRFLYAFMGRDRIPLNTGSKNLSIKESIDFVFNQHPDPSKICDALCLIFSRSPQFSINRVLKILYQNSQLKKISHIYLKSDINLNYDSFIDLWKDKARKIIRTDNDLSEQLSILRNFEIAEVWLRTGIDRINSVIDVVLFESDRDYLIDLQWLLDLCISLCKANSFDEKSNKCDDINQKAINFLRKIEKNPTKLSIEEIYPIINKLCLIIKSYLNNLHQSSKPELNIRSAVASYHIKENNQIALQVKIENTAEGHAEQVELIIENNIDLYELINSQVISYGTIRGNDNETQIIALRLNPKVIPTKAFTLKTSAKFRTRQGEDIETLPRELPIQLGDDKVFVAINPNPYAQWARGGMVVDKSMFFGRNEFIKKAYSAICNNYRSYVIYGQFRSGKSSILHHLEQELKNNSQILVAEIGDVGRLMDDNSPTPLLYQMLFGILRRIHKSIQDKERIGLPKLGLFIPTSREFYGHPAPLDYFNELFDIIKEKFSSYVEWQEVRIVVTMDEFTYLYEKIVQGKLSQDFMKNWKALLAANYFNVVLVAQDVFPKFRNKYDNAFQTMQPERVSYLNEIDAKALIDKPIHISIDGNSESRFTEKEAIDRICELTACSPYYIQIFCNQLVDYINSEKQPYITKANVNIVKDRLLRGDKRLDNTTFTNLINDGDPSPEAILHSDLIKVLKKIAEHTKNDPYCSRNKINCKTQTDINEILKDLEERDVIETHGEKGSRIRVGLFKEWLNENPDFMEQ
jgi:tetratricopeptide (TPR) repeat protein